ncbi:hypothetical protein [Actinoplanes sp. NPDC026619]|uniref:WapI family immunity protein n=1 Tax=Actinoplanes sp. NPDC026619 TaxID=3155798 RepID=UPI0033C54D92
MEIRSDDGAWLRVWPVGYQFGVEAPDEWEEWDDWLVIAAEATTADRRTWSFRDPCLTTAEAGDLARWLRRPPGEHEILFTEPNIAFRTRSGRLDVSFSHESLPPWLPGSGLGRVYTLGLDLSDGDLARAADQWAAEIALFPSRAAGA